MSTSQRPCSRTYAPSRSRGEGLQLVQGSNRGVGGFLCTRKAQLQPLGQESRSSREGPCGSGGQNGRSKKRHCVQPSLWAPCCARTVAAKLRFRLSAEGGEETDAPTCSSLQATASPFEKFLLFL